KSQAKKVVCIPAPAAANSGRPSGEVVPSDLWAWRKYGQKPIKGFPYPRGHYRYSSSKGCSARKQVERSRTDPNMLVITYTSEHNHPWPTQRNALAGSTRTQPPKNNAGSKSSSSPQTSSKPKSLKEEHKDNVSNGAVSEVVVATSTDEESLTGRNEIKAIVPSVGTSQTESTLRAVTKGPNLGVLIPFTGATTSREGITVDEIVESIPKSSNTMWLNNPEAAALVVSGEPQFHDEQVVYEAVVLEDGIIEDDLSEPEKELFNDEQL
ncbi:hypothetical protein IFM89_000573, partial [Coptis chinensis]